MNAFATLFLIEQRRQVPNSGSQLFVEQGGQACPQRSGRTGSVARNMTVPTNDQLITALCIGLAGYVGNHPSTPLAGRG